MQKHIRPFLPILSLPASSILLSYSATKCMFTGVYTDTGGQQSTKYVNQSDTKGVAKYQRRRSQNVIYMYMYIIIILSK